MRACLCTLRWAPHSPLPQALAAQCTIARNTHIKDNLQRKNRRLGLARMRRFTMRHIHDRQTPTSWRVAQQASARPHTHKHTALFYRLCTNYSSARNHQPAALACAQCNSRAIRRAAGTCWSSCCWPVHGCCSAHAAPCIQSMLRAAQSRRVLAAAAATAVRPCASCRCCKPAACPGLVQQLHGGSESIDHSMHARACAACAWRLHQSSSKLCPPKQQQLSQQMLLHAAFA